jgi:hypothetical protein
MDDHQCVRFTLDVEHFFLSGSKSWFNFSIQKLTSTPSTWYNFFAILQNIFIKKELFAANPLLFKILKIPKKKILQFHAKSSQLPTTRTCVQDFSTFVF